MRGFWSSCRGLGLRAGGGRPRDPSRARPGGVWFALGLALAGDLVAQTWTQLTAPAGPRRFHAMAFDDARGRLVLFGGYDNASVLGDTWEFDGVAWSVATPASSPPARLYHAMVFDSRRGRTVVFGGDGIGALLADTWEYDGATWMHVPTANAPSPRYSATVGYDPVRGRTILFGGTDPIGLTLADTWEYDGSDWAPTNPLVSPPRRSRATLTHDAAHHRMVLFGGFDGQAVAGNVLGLSLGDTWTYDGLSWTPVAGPGPQARSLHTAVYDRVRGRTLVFGGDGIPLQGGHGGSGYTAQVYNDLWQFDGATWAPVAMAVMPPKRYAAGMAVDGRTGIAYLFGGGTSSALFADTWRLDPAAGATWTRYGSSCTGSSGPIELDHVPGSLPVLGGTFHLQLSGLPPVASASVVVFDPDLVQWSGALLPLELDAGRAPCLLWIAPSGPSWVLLHASATASFSLPLPLVPAWQGLVFGVQSFTLDAGFAFPVTPSNAGVLRLW